MKIEKFIDLVINDTYERFKKSDYPRQPFSLSFPFDKSENDWFEIHIRTSAIIPTFIREKYDSAFDRAAACPSVERIFIPEWMRNQGFLTGLVNKLGAHSGVDIVCLSNVTNQEFSQYLAQNCVWRVLKNECLPDSPAANFSEGWPASYYRVFSEID